MHKVLEYKEIWKKLEDKYNKSEVIEQISKQITTLNNLEDGDYAGIIKSVDNVERANLDLRAAGNTTVLNNPSTVWFIMNQCPRTLREEITDELNGKKTSEEFDVMLVFLINNRKNAQRLAILAGDVKPKIIQPKQKGASQAVEGKRGDSGGGGGSHPWVCGTSGCPSMRRGRWYSTETCVFCVLEHIRSESARRRQDGKPVTWGTVGNGTLDFYMERLLRDWFC